MSKKSNREIVLLGQSTRDVSAIKSAVLTGLGAPAAVIQLAQLRDEELVKENRSRFAELVEAETAAANARADEIDARPQLYAGSADPGSIVGLDGFTPDSDTPVNGDPDRTDQDAG